MDQVKPTIIDSFGARRRSSCGYCKSQSSPFPQRHTHGMWAHCMTVKDYQDLIDRGWRRSGQYCYKPNNKTTCCPSYTIKCDAKTFQLSKSHKKVLKKMNKFLRDGQQLGKAGGNADGGIECMNIDHNEVGESSALAEAKLIAINQPKVSIDINDVMKLIGQSAADKPLTSQNTASTESNMAQSSSSDALAQEDNKSEAKNNKCGNVAGPDPTKPLQQKAKVLRQQRKLEKQLAKANSLPGTGTETVAAPSTSMKKSQPKNGEQTLQSLIGSEPVDGRHKLKVKLVSSQSAATDAALDLYRRYQIGVHKDPPSKITRKSFENFLVRSPLQTTLVNVDGEAFERTQNVSFELYRKYQTNIHHDRPDSIKEFIDFLCTSPLKHEKPDDGPPSGYGSFHQQYWLDDTLIAVGVIDILPKCVSSVYFFYDPDYNFLTLGTYGTLRELQFVQELNQSCEGISEYYMGFYIHSCPKMRYKGRLKPSYLLCPEIYTWHLLDDDIIQRLDESKYSRFNNDPSAKDLNDFDPATDIHHLRLLADYKYLLSYRDYKEFKDGDANDANDDDLANFCEYGKLVGKLLSRRILYVV